MSETNEIICVKNLKKSFGKTEILKDISFSVKKGQVQEAENQQSSAAFPSLRP